MKNYINEKIRIFAVLLSIIVIPLLGHSQENKVIDITVSGSGVTKEEAKQNALRNAIEQAYGAFISSNTEILNDELVKDEIISIANGNIQKYDIVSIVNVPGGIYSATLSVTVSINNLSSFIENKGGKTEFKGSLFGFNIKNQELNEVAEEKALNNILDVALQIFANSFDYSVKIAGEPILFDRRGKSIPQYIENRHSIDYWKEKYWEIPLKAEITSNSNFAIFSDYIVNSLLSLSMTDSEVDDYKKLNKKFYTLIIRVDNLGEVSENNLYWSGYFQGLPTDSKSFFNSNNNNSIHFHEIEIKNYDEYKSFYKQNKRRRWHESLGSGYTSDKRIIYKPIYLRNVRSFRKVYEFITSLIDEHFSFEIDNGIDKIEGKNVISYFNYKLLDEDHWSVNGNLTSNLILFNDESEKYSKSSFARDYPQKLIPVYYGYYKDIRGVYRNKFFPDLNRQVNKFKLGKDFFIVQFSFPFSIDNDYYKTNFNFKDIKSSKEISKIKEYRIKKLSVGSNK